MELRRLSLYLALFVLAICSQSCSDAHSMHKRGSDYNYDDDSVMGDEAVGEEAMGDEATDDEAQNDAEGNDADEDIIPELITTQSSSYNITVGKTVRLECKVQPNNHPVVQWLKDGEPLFMGKVPMKNANKRLVISPDDADHDLLIRDLRPADSGVYRCEVLQHDPKTMVDHSVFVVEAPRIINFTASSGGIVSEGEDLLLTCNVAGTPPPSITWTYAVGGMNVDLKEQNASFTLNTALLKNVGRGQAGSYFCYAFNGLGNAQAELRVKVLHKPRVHVHKTVVNSDLEIEAILQCSAHGEPIPHITWYKDGRMVDFASERYVITTEGPHSNLTVTPHEDSDFGTFTCEARNAHGKHNNSIELVQRPVVEGVDLEGNKLSWRVSSHQPLERMELQLTDMEGTLTRVDVPVPEPNDHGYDVIYVLDSMNQGRYGVLVKAKNSKEWSTASDSVFVDYEAPLPIQTASIYHGNSHSIRPGTSVVLSTVFMYVLVRLF